MSDSIAVRPVSTAPSSGILTRHAEKRIRQRGLREHEITYVLRFGTRIADNMIVLTDNAIDDEIAARRREISRLDHMRGLTAVVEGDRILTVYRMSRERRRRGMRGED
jgi:hypothetical protein